MKKRKKSLRRPPQIDSKAVSEGQPYQYTSEIKPSQRINYALAWFREGNKIIFLEIILVWENQYYLWELIATFIKKEEMKFIELCGM
jgi:hypothetical protein